MEDKFECWLPVWKYLHKTCKEVVKKIKIDLKKNFQIDISEEDIIEILGELEERNIATSSGTGWIKKS